MYMPKYTYQIEGGLKHTWRVDNVIETANAKNELVFTDRQKKKQKCILDMMRLLMNEIKQRDIKLFAISGTLLGAKRNKGLIPYDDDGDFGFTMTEYNKLKELSRSFSHPEYEIDNISGDIGFRMVNKGSYIAHLDLFAMGIDEDPDKIVHIGPIIDNKPCFYIQYVFPQDWMDASSIETLEWCDFEDFRVPCPTNAEEQLKHIYSPNCLTTFVPDKRQMAGIDMHDYTMTLLRKPFADISTNMYNILRCIDNKKDTKGHIHLLLTRLGLEIIEIDFDTDRDKKIQRIHQTISDFVKHR